MKIHLLSTFSRQDEVSNLDAILHACARDILLTCAQWNISLEIGHIPREHLRDTVDTLSRWYLSSTYRDRVATMVKAKGITMQHVPNHLFTLSNNIIIP